MKKVEAIQPDKFSDKVQLSLALQNTIQTDVSPRVREKAIHKLVKLRQRTKYQHLKTRIGCRFLNFMFMTALKI